MMDEPLDLLPEQVAYYREVLAVHGSVHGASMCQVCGVARCPDWVDAYDKLAAAGLMMTEAPVWKNVPTSRRRR